MDDPFILSDDNAIHDQLQYLLFGGKGWSNQRLLNRRIKEFGTLNQARMIFVIIALVLKGVQPLSHLGAVDLNLLTTLLQFLDRYRFGSEIASSNAEDAGRVSAPQIGAAFAL